jgi:phosphatidate cytidylyltransferase
LKQRIITGLIAGIGFIGLTFIGGWAYTCLLILLALIGYYEYLRLNGFTITHPAALTGYAGMLLILLPWSKLGLGEPSLSLLIWVLMFGLLAITVVTKNRTTLDGVSLLFLGSLYVGYGFASMMEVRDSQPDGLILTFLAFASIWASDIGAYFVGRAIGKRKLWPAISPNKTIEGAAGGVLLSVLTAVGIAWMFPDSVVFWKAAVIGLVAATAGQLGDLIQSAYKRIRDVKDTGNLLPGHGGVLDRCDSWLIVFPLLVLTGLLP